MPTFHLTDEESQLLMNRLINSDPLLMKIAAQLREQQPNPAPTAAEIKRAGGIKLDGQGREIRS